MKFSFVRQVSFLKFRLSSFVPEVSFFEFRQVFQSMHMIIFAFMTGYKNEISICYMVSLITIITIQKWQYMFIWQVRTRTLDEHIMLLEV